MKTAIRLCRIFLCLVVVTLGLESSSGPALGKPVLDSIHIRPNAAHLNVPNPAKAHPDMTKVGGSCSITCSDGLGTTTGATNALDCACDCWLFCGGVCMAQGGGETAYCGFYN
jgi:hypothetical protein